MKKNIFSIMAISAVLLGMSSCGGKEKVDLGTVTLEPTTKTISYDESYKITPTFSEVGEAKDKSYKWSSSADSIATVKTVLGGAAEVTAKRIGEAIIAFESTDGLIKKTAKVTVEPRATLLNGIYFNDGVSANEIKNNMSPNYKYDKGASTANSLIFNNSYNESEITKLIYILDGDKLKELNVILNDNADVKKAAQNYMEERFMNTGITKNGVMYYLNTGYVSSNSVALNVAMGLFLNQTIEGTAYPLGIRITNYSNIK